MTIDYTYHDTNTFTPTGWICPRCGKVNAPWMPYCDCVRHTPDWWNNERFIVTCSDLGLFETNLIER